MPGVTSASAINHLPIAGDIWGYPFAVEGRPRPRPGESPVAAYRVVLPGYFRAMHLAIVQGRDLTESDRLGAPGVVLVNEWLARHYWPGEEPLGKRIIIGDPQDPASVLTVVGVVKNAVRHEWTAAPEEEVYVPYLQTREYLQDPGAHVGEMTLVVRTRGEPTALAPAVEREVWALDRAVTISEVQTMERVVAEATAQPRFNLLLLTVFAAVALILAAVGIYGVVSYSVARRTNEIGIRIALGASRRDVLGLVVGQSMVVALAGAVVGLLGAAGLSRLIAGLLYGVRPSDPVTFVTAALILVGVGLGASYVPARRATRLDPLAAVRYE
jgi:putative ABC transport system permease protein